MDLSNQAQADRRNNSVMLLNPDEFARVDALLKEADKEQGAQWRVEEKQERETLGQSITALSTKLSPENDRDGEPAMSSSQIDSLLLRALRIRPDGLSPLLESACRAYIRCNKHNFSDWSHSVCHSFENYGSEDSGSMLDYPEVIPAATELVNEVVARSITARSEGSSSRVLGGVIDYALSLVDQNNLDQPWSFKPNRVADSVFIELIRSTRSSDDLYCSSNTPREYLNSVIDKAAASDERLFGSPIPIRLLNLMRTVDNSDKIAHYFAKYHQDTSIDEAQADTLLRSSAIARAAAELDSTEAGIYLDVDGTLIVSRGEGMKLSDISTFLDALIDRAGVVTLISGGDPSSATDRLRSLGLPERFLPVTSKERYRGKHLEVLIDDTTPESQGMSAACYIRAKSYSNCQARELLIERDPCGVIARYNRQKMNAEELSLGDLKFGAEARIVHQQELSEQDPHVKEEDQRDALRFYNSMFQDVPLHSGHEWCSMSSGDIAAQFMLAVTEGEDELRSKRDQEIRCHNQKHPLKRWWREKITGWKPSEVVSRARLVEEVITRCEALASWMETKQHSPFYVGSDMSDYITKPRRVAELLREELNRLHEGSS